MTDQTPKNCEAADVSDACFCQTVLALWDRNLGQIEFSMSQAPLEKFVHSNMTLESSRRCVADPASCAPCLSLSYAEGLCLQSLASTLNRAGLP